MACSWNEGGARPERRLAWHCFVFDLPPGWEIVGYGTDPRNGQMELHTRRGFVGLLSWVTFKMRPDLGRVSRDMYAEILASENASRRGREEEGATGAQHAGDVHSRQVEGFYLMHSRVGAPCLAVTFVDEPRVLLSWIFPAFDIASLEREWLGLLASFHENSGSVREWSLFGLRLRLPAEFHLSELCPDPGQVYITLENPAHLQVTLRRWALPEYRLDGLGLAGFCSRVLTATGAHVLEVSPCRFRGLEAVRARYRRRGQYGFDKLAGRWWPGGCVLWHDPGEKRLYCLEQVGKEKLARLEVEHVVPA